MKTLLILAFAFVFADAGGEHEHPQEGCVFDAQEACNNCPYDRNWIQYVADGCDCNTFYMCEKNNGVITAHPLKCDPCHCFSNADWSCSIQIKDLSVCPPNATEPIYPIPTQPLKIDYFCLDWDHDWREKVYYDQQASCQVSYTGVHYPHNDPAHTGLHTSGNALNLYGHPCNVEVPYFQNNQFRQFTMCGMFMWYNWFGSIEMGLVFNGYYDDCYPGSIRLLKTTGDQIEAFLQMESGFSVSLVNPVVVDPWCWHEVCLRFNGEVGTLELSVDHVSRQISRPIRLKGLTRQMHCNLRLGEVLEKYWGGYYIYSLRGAMDDWCFVPAIVPDSYFYHLPQ